MMESSDDDWMTSVRFWTEDASRNNGTVDFVSVISREVSCKLGFCVARLRARRSDFGVDRSLAVNFSPKCFMTTGLLLFRESRLFSVEIYERKSKQTSVLGFVFYWLKCNIASTWVHWESNSKSTLSSDKDLGNNSLSLCVNQSWRFPNLNK